MKKVSVAITFATAYLVIYHIAPHAGWNDNIIITMFILSPAVVIYMVYSILKHGTPSRYTFEERFYDDLDYIRNGKEERKSVE